MEDRSPGCIELAAQELTASAANTTKRKILGCTQVPLERMSRNRLSRLRLTAFGFDRSGPDDERDDDLAVAEVAFEDLGFPSVGDFHQLTPFRGIVECRSLA